MMLLLKGESKVLAKVLSSKRNPSWIRYNMLNKTKHIITQEI